MTLTTDIPPEAETRILRVISTVFGIAGVAFLLLELPQILAERSYLQPWWTPAAVAVVFGIPVVAALFSRLLTLRALRFMLTVYAVGFLAALASWTPALQEPMPVVLAPWPIAATALATTTAALAFRPGVAWAYLGVASVGVGLVRFTGSGGVAGNNALQLGFFWLTFSVVFTVLSIVIMDNARVIDRAAASARTAAAATAASLARGREQTRLDALVHDEVIATLYYASLGDPALAPAVQRQAGRAMTELARLRGPDGGYSIPVAAGEFVNRLRSVALGLSDTMAFSVVGHRSSPVPADVAAAFAEAASEAVRNSVAHAGPGPVSRTATATVGDRGITLVVADDGAGFDHRSVGQHRLGIRVSIKGRMATVPGGSAMVRAVPGSGTVVTMTWRSA